jgi:hypothetical protein
VGALDSRTTAAPQPHHSRTERDMQAEPEPIAAQRATLVIAHCLSTIVEADGTLLACRRQSWPHSSEQRTGSDKPKNRS